MVDPRERSARLLMAALALGALLFCNLACAAAEASECAALKSVEELDASFHANAVRFASKCIELAGKVDHIALEQDTEEFIRLTKTTRGAIPEQAYTHVNIYLRFDKKASKARHYNFSEIKAVLGSGDGADKLAPGAQVKLRCDHVEQQTGEPKPVQCEIQP